MWLQAESIMHEAMSQQKQVIPVYGDISSEEQRKLPLSLRHLKPIDSRKEGFLNHLSMRIKESQGGTGEKYMDEDFISEAKPGILSEVASDDSISLDLPEDAALSQEDTIKRKNDLELALISSGIYIQKFTMDHHGGYVHLKEVGVTLVVPEGSLPEGTVTEMYLGVSWRAGDSPHLGGKQTRTSPIVVIGPHDLTFQKPVYLSFPHCIPHVDDEETETKFWTSKTDLLGTCKWTTDENDPVVIYSQTRCTAALWNLCKYTTSSNSRKMLAAVFGEFDPKTRLLQIAVSCISDTPNEIMVLDSRMEGMGFKRVVLDGFFRLYICPHSDGDRRDGDHDNNDHVPCENDHDVLVTLKDYQGWTLTGEDEKALDYQRMIDDSRPYCAFFLTPESTTPCPKFFISKILVAQQGLKGKDARMSSVEFEVYHPLHKITKIPGTEQLDIQALQSSHQDPRPLGGNQSHNTSEPLQQQSLLNPSAPKQWGLQGSSEPLQQLWTLNPSAPHQTQWGLPAPGQSHHTHMQHQQLQDQHPYAQHQPPQGYCSLIPHLPKSPHSSGTGPRQKHKMPNTTLTESPFPQAQVNVPLEQAQPHAPMQQLQQTPNDQVPEKVAHHPPSEWNIASLPMPSVDQGESNNSLFTTPGTMTGSPNAMAQSTQQMLGGQNPAEIILPSQHGDLEQSSLSESGQLSPPEAKRFKPSCDPTQLLTNTSPLSVPSNEGQHSNEVTQPIIPTPPHISSSSSVLVTPSVPVNQDYEAYPIVETPSELKLSEQRTKYQLQCQQQQHQQFPNLSSQQQRPHQALCAQLYGNEDLAQTLCVDVRQTNMAATCGAGAILMDTAGQSIFVQNIERLEIHHNGDQELMSVAPPAHVHLLQRYLPLGAKANLDRIFKIPGVWEAVVRELRLENDCCPKEPVEFIFGHLQCSFLQLIWLLRRIGERVKENVNPSKIESVIEDVSKARFYEVEWENLRKNLPCIAYGGVDIRRLLDSLFSKGIISESDMEKIEGQQTSSDKCSLLLRKVLKCSLDKDPVEHLRQCFVDQGRGDLADLLAVKPEDVQESYSSDEPMRPDEQPALRQIQSPEVAA
ncbi:uncharacterized protein LOC106174229 [Lingula anatina]|uniref:Netrin receptor UNC5 n=1 Tax=Lingula anatina TaxID=7574 RepID=A0A1S3JLY3_LINAN|nr:uncharacterized protein LOC106174229 [Lingula anatina]|eukprot:XP_013411131.1 uncharacterized protein LOC106174229 [Lingula anatina]